MLHSEAENEKWWHIILGEELDPNSLSHQDDEKANRVIDTIFGTTSTHKWRNIKSFNIQLG